jgi:hypothetical protein
MDDFGSGRQPNDGASVVAGQIKSPGDQDGAKSEAGLLTICKPTRGEKMVKRAAPVRRIECTVPRVQVQCRPKKRPRSLEGRAGPKDCFGRGHDGLPPAFSLAPTIGPSKRGEHLTGSAPWRLGGAALYCRHVRSCHL